MTADHRLHGHEVIIDTGAASELTPAGRTVRMVQRERVFILAASQEQASIFARRWAQEGEGRRLTDAIYLTRYSQGHFVTQQDRIVQLEGFHLNRDFEYIQHQTRRTLAKTGLTWDDVELEAVTA